MIARIAKNNLDLFTAVLLISLGVYIFYPGAMTGDSVDQWRQVLNPDQIGNFYPPAMVYLWILMNHLIPGPQGMLIIHYCMYFLSIYIFGKIFFKNILPKVLFLLFVGLFPPIFFLTGVIWKDVTMLGSISLSIAFLFLFQNNKKYLWLVLSSIFFLFGVSVRFNAIVCSIPYSIYISYIILNNTKRYRAVIAALLSVAMMAFFFIASNFINNHYVKEGNKTYYFENSFLIWDLWGMSIEVNKNLIPSYVFNIKSQHLSVDQLKKYYRPDSNTVMWHWQYLNTNRWKKIFPEKKFKMAFLSQVIKNPKAYLKVRFRLIMYMLGIKKPIFTPFCFNIQKFSKKHYLYPFSKNLEITHVKACTLSSKIADFLLEKTPLYLVWVYIVTALIQIGILLLLRKNQYTSRILLILSIALFYWAPYFLVSPSADFRYSNLTVFFCILSLPITINTLLLSMKSRGITTTPKMLTLPSKKQWKTEQLN